MQRESRPDMDSEREEKRSFEHGSSGATADAAVTEGLKKDEASPDTPFARRVDPEQSPAPPAEEDGAAP